MLYYKPKHLKSVVPSIFTTEPPSAADSIILDSRILSEEKLNLNSKFALLDQFSHRAFDIKEYNLTQRELPSITKHVIQNNKLDVWGETTLTLYRNQFLYTSLDIHEKYSPVVLFIYVKKGDPNTKMRLFCSVRFQQPNRFNAEIETSGRVLKYHSREGTTFYDPTLYVAILAQNDVVITIKSEFAKPPLPRKVLQLKKKDEQTQEFEELADLIIRKRKLKQKSLNFINFNRSLLRQQRIESPCNTERLKEIKYKQTTILKEQNLKHIAQIALHDVAKEIKQKQMNIQLKQLHKEWICKKWIQIVTLINYIVPSISNYIKEINIDNAIHSQNQKQHFTSRTKNKTKNLVALQNEHVDLYPQSTGQSQTEEQPYHNRNSEIKHQKLLYSHKRLTHCQSNQKMHQYACQTQEQKVGIHALDEDYDILSMQTDLWGDLEDEVAINLATAPLAIIVAGKEQEQEGSPSLLNS